MGARCGPSLEKKEKKLAPKERKGPLTRCRAGGGGSRPRRGKSLDDEPCLGAFFSALLLLLLLLLLLWSVEREEASQGRSSVGRGGR